MEGILSDWFPIRSGLRQGRTTNKSIRSKCLSNARAVGNQSTVSHYTNDVDRYFSPVTITRRFISRLLFMPSRYFFFTMMLHISRRKDQYVQRMRCVERARGQQNQSMSFLAKSRCPSKSVLKCERYTSCLSFCMEQRPGQWQRQWQPRWMPLTNGTCVARVQRRSEALHRLSTSVRHNPIQTTSLV